MQIHTFHPIRSLGKLALDLEAERLHHHKTSRIKVKSHQRQKQNKTKQKEHILVHQLKTQIQHMKKPERKP
jgi:hypothetical protein